MGRTWKVWSGELVLECCKQGGSEHCDGSSEDQIGNRNMDCGGHAKRLWRETRTLSGIELKVIHVIFSLKYDCILSVF